MIDIPSHRLIWLPIPDSKSDVWNRWQHRYCFGTPGQDMQFATRALVSIKAIHAPVKFPGWSSATTMTTDKGRVTKKPSHIQARTLKFISAFSGLLQYPNPQNSCSDCHFPADICFFEHLDGKSLDIKKWKKSSPARTKNSLSCSTCTLPAAWLWILKPDMLCPWSKLSLWPDYSWKYEEH